MLQPVISLLAYSAHAGKGRPLPSSVTFWVLGRVAVLDLEGGRIPFLESVERNAHFNAV